jgi:hypothetical protein
VIGVFAIFSPEPRESFNAMQRRELTEFGEQATRDLTVRRAVSAGRCYQSSPVFHGSLDDRAANPSRPMSSQQSSAKAKCHDISPVALRYHKTSENGKLRSRVFINSESRDLSFQHLDYTPPMSDDSAGPSPTLPEPKGFGKNYKQLSLGNISHKIPDDVETPDSPTFGDIVPRFGILLPRAFHGRDRKTLSSDNAAFLLIPHPNSPIEQISDTSSILFDTQGRKALLDEAVLFGEILDAKLLEECERLCTSTSEAGEIPSGVVNNHPTQYHESPVIQRSFPTDLTPGEAHGSIAVQAEARFAAELWAKNLNFDIVYAVELIPKRMFMSDAELKSSGNTETRILVSYGLGENIDFDIPIHLNVLRGSGATTWKNDNAMTAEYSRGFMMPLVFEDGMLHYRSSGVVFGAFRRTPNGMTEFPNLKMAEVERLRHAANVLREILSKSPSLRRPSQHETEALSRPSLQPYPANEAVEVGKYSLDATLIRRSENRKRTRRRFQSQE